MVVDLRLIDKVFSCLTHEGKSIPDLSREPEMDEFEIMQAIAQLECAGDAALTGFDKIYREDGGAIYLAKYARTT